MDNKKIHIHIQLLIYLIFGSLFMTVGYATVTGVTLSIGGIANVLDTGSVRITNVEVNASSYVTEKSPATVNSEGTGINFNLSVNANRDVDYYIRYKITIINDSFTDQNIQATNFSPTINGSNSRPNISYEITDASGNQALSTTIQSGTSAFYYVTITIYPTTSGSWTISGDTSIEAGENDEGILIGSIPNNATGDLSGNNTKTMITATVINTHTKAKEFSFSINNSNFKLVDSSDNDLTTMTINAETTQSYNFYIQRLPNAKFPSNPQKLNINFNDEDKSSSMGIVTLTVDPDQTITDDEAPYVSDVTAEIRPNDDGTYTNYKIYLSWNGRDNIGVNHYIVETYRANSINDTGTLISTNNTNADETEMYLNVGTNGYYYFKVYGTDGHGNIASQSEISSCTTNEGHCSRSTTEQFKWNFSVTLTLTYATASSGTITTNGNTRTVVFNVTYDGSVTTTLSGVRSGLTSYDPPTSISNPQITYANGTTETLSTNTNKAGYSYANNELNIWHITGDITMSAEGTSCLAKGTKILLANGSTKNIENIGYDDLLAVWNYDTGSLTYEYPLWIEKEATTKKITRITFEDNNYIDIVNDHGFYNTDTNLFINLSDENFKEGLNIAKIDNNGNFKTTKIKKIEIINKDTTLYFVGTTSYYNIIANNILTTDNNLLISNLYGFTSNATWPKEKSIIVNNPKNIVEYSQLKDVLPYYLYKGFRAREVGYLINNNIISLNEFKHYIKSIITKQNILKDPIQKNNSNYWMVTTSEDFVTDNNKNLYLKEEGSFYTLPFSKNLNFIGWLNTSDNKIYYPGSRIKVSHGLHFIAQYNELF